MNWYQETVRSLAFVVIWFGVIHPAAMAGDSAKPSKGSNKAALSAGAVANSGDPLDAALERAGMRRADLGWSPGGSWMTYTRQTLHKLDHVDDLFRQPLATVPFTRVLAQAVRGMLGAEGLAHKAIPRYREAWGSGNVYRLAHTAVLLRYSGSRVYSPRLRAEETALDEAIVALYKYAGEPTRFVTFGKAGPPGSPGSGTLLQPNLETEIKQRAAGLQPEVSRILGRLVLDMVDAHRWAALAFRNVPVEQRLKIARQIDTAVRVQVVSGLEYADVYDFDDVAKAWDEASLWHAALKCVEALDRTRRALQALPPEKLKSSASFDWETPLGWIRIRGTDNDVIDATDALLIVDLGGDDTWRGPVGASSPTRLLGLALDLSGNDVYEGRNATQGAGIVGVGILFDAAGNDRYQAENYAQGVGQFGFGALIDLGGDDVYRAHHSAQGSGTFVGIGLLADAAGNDEYDIFGGGQGYGGPGAVGILADRAGNDVYRAEPDSGKSGRFGYGSTTHSASEAQGFGIGRFSGAADGRTWAGGLGALVDIEGDDSYLAGDWSQGTGYYFGTGLLYDGTGNDRYEGGFLFTQAAAGHFAIGLILDEGGDDVHLVHGGVSMGFAHDFSIAFLVAIGGNDSYTGARGAGLGTSINRSVAIFIDVGGDDAYRGKDDARPGSTVYLPHFFADYDGAGTIYDRDRTHPFLLNPFFAHTTSLGLFLDVGGKDTYWGGLSDGGVWGDEPGSDNWKVRNVGVGMDVPHGVIDWRPFGSGGGRQAP